MIIQSYYSQWSRVSDLMGTMHDDEFLSPADLAALLDIPVATLYNWRYTRTGPLGFRVGRHLRYKRIDVDEWIEEQRLSSDRR